MRTAPLLCALSLMALGGCHSSQPDASASASEANEHAVEDSHAPAVSGGIISMSPQQFVNVTAASEAFEIDTSRMAVASASKPQVRDFARKMIDSHALSGSDLRAAAARNEPPLTLDPAMSEVQKGRVEALRTSGEGFDRYYIDRQIEAHEQALVMLRAYAASAAPGPLRDFAARQLPNVTEHLAMARKLPR